MELASRVHSPALARPEKMSLNFALDVRYARKPPSGHYTKSLEWGSIVSLAVDASLMTKLASNIFQEGCMSLLSHSPAPIGRAAGAAGAGDEVRSDG